MRLNRLPPFIVPLLLLTAAVAEAGEVPDCIANPGVPDRFGFTHEIALPIGGETWYMVAPDVELQGLAAQVGQPQDIPGHCWEIVGGQPNGRPKLVGQHYNTGPSGAGLPARFWSSNAGNHEQLYWVDAIISRWTPKISAERFAEGYVHYHELVRAGDGCLHPRLVVWFRHTALKSFRFDGGAPRFTTDGLPFRLRNVPHQVQPGIDYAFAPQYDQPYRPEQRSCAFAD